MNLTKEQKELFDALHEYMRYCSGLWGPGWDEEDDMSAARCFLEYWKMEKLPQTEIRGNYG